MQENGYIEISTSLGAGKTVKSPSEAINYIITTVKGSETYNNFIASFNAGKSCKDLYNTEYEYHDFGIQHEPLILEPEDWTSAQWETICKVFGMHNAERIKVSGYKLEAFGIPKHSGDDAKEEFLDNGIRKEVIIKVKDPEVGFKLFNKIDSQLVGNQDYIDSRICLNRSKNRKNSTQNEVHLTIFEDSESDPEIKI